MNTDNIDTVHIIWLLYRRGIQDHIDRNNSALGESEAEYRERAEKAGLVRVVNFIGKAYQTKAD